MEEPPQISMEQEQGAIQSCIYCELIYPETRGNCPECNNFGARFRPARMMDRESSSRMILDMLNEIDLSDIHEIEEAGEKREKLISILKDIVLYGFDMKDALVTRIRDLDMEIQNNMD